MSGRVVPLVGATEPWHGGPASAHATCVLAPNPSPWTLDGTNTWLLSGPGETALVVDPGPDDAGHREAIARAADDRGVRIGGVLLTHGHVDHSEGARILAEEWHVGVRALDPRHVLGDEGLVAGDVVSAGDWVVEIIGTPGHSSDSVCFLLPHDGSLLTGDTILGRGTSLVAWPDGRLGDYLESLQRLRDAAGDVERLLPGHGPVLVDPVGVIENYLDHRWARLSEVSAVVSTGLIEPAEIVRIVYADVPQEVWPAAELTVRAQLQYLSERDAPDARHRG